MAMVPYGIGRGFDRSRAHGWYIRVRGKKEYFETEELRDGEYDQRIAEAKLYGEQASATITPGDRQLLQEMQRLAAPSGYTPMEIFERGLTLVGAKPRSVVAVGKAVADLTRETAQRLKDGVVRGRYEKDLRNILKRFAGRFQDRDLHSITNRDIDLYLKSLGVGPQTRVNYARVIGRLFLWAGVPNPVEITERVKRTPQIFKAPEVEALFKRAVEGYPALVPMLVIQWFTGIRPTATHQMTWHDLHRETKTVVIRPEIAKLGEPEVIEHLPDCFWAWVERSGRKTGRIAPLGHELMAKKLHRDLGFSGKPGKRHWPTDVARHSFASHLYPIAKSIDTVSRTICHRGNRTTLKHYVAKSVTEPEAKAYFAVLDGLRTSQGSA